MDHVDVCADLTWWRSILSGQDISCSLLPCIPLDLDIWVDAATSYGVGLVVDGQWAAWQLVEGWKVADSDIGWVKTIAMGLAVLWLVLAGIHDAKVTIHEDNTGVLGALDKGQSGIQHAISQYAGCHLT